MGATMIDELYQEAWHELARARRSIEAIERECTPVLVFGQWRTSWLATAGLNPSEMEFRDQGRLPLASEQQRFLHWPDDGLGRAERYFVRGRAYSRWFDRYTAFLEGAGASFGAGTACHTDYLSPFATTTGVGACSPAIRRKLARYGYPLWVRVLNALPQLRVVFGHGAGWQEMPGLLGFERWTPISTPFDQKGGRTPIPRPYLLFAETPLHPSGREIRVYWWRPNRDGAPLTWLNRDEAQQLGALITSSSTSI
jgi:hypothetical protein